MALKVTGNHSFFPVILVFFHLIIRIGIIFTTTVLFPVFGVFFFFLFTRFSLP